MPAADHGGEHRQGAQRAGSAVGPLLTRRPRTTPWAPWAQGEADLTLAVVAFLFTHYPCLHPRERPFSEAHGAVEGARREWAAVRSLWAVSPDYVEPSKLRRLARSTAHASEQVRHATSRAAADVCHWRALRDRARDYAFQCLLRRARGDPARIPDRKAEREKQQFTRLSGAKLRSLLGERPGGVEPEDALAKITQVSACADAYRGAARDCCGP